MVHFENMEIRHGFYTYKIIIDTENFIWSYSGRVSENIRKLNKISFNCQSE